MQTIQNKRTKKIFLIYIINWFIHKCCLKVSYLNYNLDGIYPNTLWLLLLHSLWIKFLYFKINQWEKIQNLTNDQTAKKCKICTIFRKIKFLLKNPDSKYTKNFDQATSVYIYATWIYLYIENTYFLLCLNINNWIFNQIKPIDIIPIS